MKTWKRLPDRQWQQWLGSVFGAGFLPVAPGTWGAAAGALLLLPLYGYTGAQTWPLIGGLIVLASVTGARAARDLAPDWGEDPKPFVLDEVAGMWTAMLGHAVRAPELLVAFFLFRVFDIWKPFGIRRLEAVGKGWGVMLDDLAAGIAANALIWGIRWFFPDLFESLEGLY